MSDSLTIVITGSSKGIGFALAKIFLENGHQVIINASMQSSMDVAISKFSAFQKHCLFIVKDVRDEDFGDYVFDKAISSFKKVDIWINNAGIPQDYKSIADIEFSEIKQIMFVNLMATMQISKQVFKKMNQQGFGSIYSMEGFGSDGRKGDKMGIYGTSKIALSYFTESYAMENRFSPVKIGRLSPGMVATDFLKLPYQTANAKEKQTIRKIYNLLGSDADTVALFFYKQLLKPTKQNCHIRYLTTLRILEKLARAVFSPADYFSSTENKQPGL
jgi:short-subunit dehydrogenase